MRVLGGEVFGHGFVHAMGPAVYVAVAVLFAGALACLAVRRHQGASGNPHALPMSEPELEEAAR
jgi:hypothetical protein